MRRHQSIQPQHRGPSAKLVLGMLGTILLVSISLTFYVHHQAHHDELLEQIEGLKKELANHAETSFKKDKEAHGGLSKRLLGKLETQFKNIRSGVQEQIRDLEFLVAKLEMEKKEHDLLHKEEKEEKEETAEEAEEIQHLSSALNQAPPVLPLAPPPSSKSEVVPPPPVVAASVADLQPPSTLLLILASNRPQYLEPCLAGVVKYHPRKDVQVVVSEDGASQRVQEVVDKARQAWLALLPPFSTTTTALYFKHEHYPDGNNPSFENGYWRLCAHFKWALQKAFGADASLRRVILLEEDLKIAPDFFEYFAALAPMLEDPAENLLAVSAFNDNGQSEHVNDAARLYRSDFFPGLGWMMTRAVWEGELAPKWPRAYWDDWLREPKNRLGRHFIRPEVSRTFHFGRVGVSNSEFGSFLEGIRLSDHFVKFSDLDLSYLSARRWDKEYLATVARAKLVSLQDLVSIMREGDEAAAGLGLGTGPGGDGLRVQYASFQEFERIASVLRIMDNIKANVPRTAYHGIVSTWIGGSRLRAHVVPSPAFAAKLSV